MALLAIFILAGCSQSSSREVVTFMVSGDAAELAAYETLVADFETAHPEIDVQLRHVAGQSDFNQRLAADFTAGRPADVILLNYRRYALFAIQGGLQPLDSYISQSSEIAAQDYYPQAIEAFTLEDHLWCLPQNIASLVVYYNQDLFIAGGVPLPAQDWTQEDFLAAARALTRDTDGDGQIDQYGVGITPNVARLAPFVWQAGGDIVDDPVNPTRLTLDSPAALEAFQWFVDLQVKEGVAPDQSAETAQSSEDRFLHGSLAMYFNSRRGVPTYRTIAAFDWDIAPLPRNSSTLRADNILHSDGYCMAAAAKNKEAVWKFIEFANSSHGQLIIASTGRTVPSLTAVAESTEFLTPLQPPVSNRVFIEAIPLLRRLPSITTWTAIEEITNREIERAFYGQVSVLEAALTAAEQTQPLFDQR